LASNSSGKKKGKGEVERVSKPLSKSNQEKTKQTHKKSSRRESGETRQEKLQQVVFGGGEGAVRGAVARGRAFLLGQLDTLVEQFGQVRDLVGDVGIKEIETAKSVELKIKNGMIEIDGRKEGKRGEVVRTR
jgi:hypothetical protein